MTYSVIAEIAKAIGKHKTSIQRRARKESWPSFKEAVRGGYETRFPLDTLPTQIKIAIIKLRQQKEVFLPQTGTLLPAITKTGKAPLPTPILNQAEMHEAGLKSSLIRLYTMALESAPWGEKVRAREEFITAYNSGMSWPELYKELGPLSWKTLESWALKVKRNRNDCFHLADRRGRHLRGVCSLTDEQTQIFLRTILRPNKPLVTESYRVSSAIMHQKGIENIQSEATYRRWLDRWKSRNYDLWVWAREGAKAWNDKCAMYIERDINLLQVGDVVVADGHSLNFEIINPFNGGKPTNHMTLILFYDMRSSMPLGWEIMPTENTAAISSALRRAVLRLGKYPRVVYLDNGRAFKARFFAGSQDFDEAGYSGLYKRMGCQTIYAWPYHGQSKTVERFFGTFSELERMSPTYTGTSIGNKPPRMMRGEKRHRALHEKQYGDRCLTLEEAHIVIAAWFDEYVKRPQRGHLDGACPMDAFMAGKGPGVDRAELLWMMMSIEVKTIHRNGITFQGRHYYHPALYGRRHSVTIRYDLQDTSSLWVCDTEGNLICEATPKEQLHPAAAQLGNEADKNLLREQIEAKRHQEKYTSASAITLLRNDILPEHRRQMEALGVMNEKTIAAKAPSPKLLDFDFEKAKLQAAENIRLQQEEEAKDFREGLYKLEEGDRYERLIELTSQGIDLGQEWVGFMSIFEQTPAYARQKEYWDACWEKYGLMYRTMGRHVGGNL